MKIEKFELIVYSAGMTTVAAIALLCAVKFGKLIQKTEKINVVNEIVGELNKELETPDINNGDEKKTDETKTAVDKLDEKNIIETIKEDTEDNKELTNDAEEIVGELNKEFETSDVNNSDEEKSDETKTEIDKLDEKNIVETIQEDTEKIVTEVKEAVYIDEQDVNKASIDDINEMNDDKAKEDVVGQVDNGDEISEENTPDDCGCSDSSSFEASVDSEWEIF